MSSQMIKNLKLESRDVVKNSISLLQKYEPKDGYYLAFSGGKDSVVLKHLADLSGVKYDSHYHNTTVDPPELIRFIKEVYPDVIIEKPQISMYNLIVKKKMPPTRIARYCCAYLKEWGGEGRTVLTGVRRAESVQRSKRREYENDTRLNKIHVRPIIYWSTAEIWYYIRNNNLPYCSLYDEGFKRIGCVLCPMAGKNGMLRDAARWPKIANAYKRAFELTILKREEEGLSCHRNWVDGKSMYDWWINNHGKKTTDKSLDLFDDSISENLIHP